MTHLHNVLMHPWVEILLLNRRPHKLLQLPRAMEAEPHIHMDRTAYHRDRLYTSTRYHREWVVVALAAASAAALAEWADHLMKSTSCHRECMRTRQGQAGALRLDEIHLHQHLVSTTS